MTAFRVVGTLAVMVVILPLLQNEAVGLCDWLARWLLRRAVRRLPDLERARWDEEWRGDLERLPTPLTRLVWAAATRYVAAPRQARLLRPGAALHRQQRSLALGLLLVSTTTVVFVVWTVFQIGGPAITAVVTSGMQAGVAFACSSTCFRAARRNPEGLERAWAVGWRRAWRLLGVGALLGGLGKAIWTYFQTLGFELPFPSLADGCFLASIPLLVAGVLALSGGLTGGLGRLGTLLDSLLIVASVFVLAWATGLQSAVSSNDVSPIASALSLYYPLGDLALASTGLVLLARFRVPGAGNLRMIVAASLAMTFSNLVFAYANLTLDGFYAGAMAVVGIGWLVGWQVLLVSALKPILAKPPAAAPGGGLSSPAAHRSGPNGFGQRVLLGRLIRGNVPMPIAATALTVLMIENRPKLLLALTCATIAWFVINRQIGRIEHQQRKTELRL